MSFRFFISKYILLYFDKNIESNRIFIKEKEREREREREREKEREKGGGG